MKEELRTTASLLPLFLSNAMFKVLSLAISIALLRHWSFLVTFFLPVAVISRIAQKWQYLTAAGPNHLINLLLCHHNWVKTDKERMKNCVFNNIFWIAMHTLVLTSLVVLANWILTSTCWSLPLPDVEAPEGKRTG